MNVNTGVFDRIGGGTLSKRGFYASLGLATLWGLVVTAFFAWKMAGMGFAPNVWHIIFLGIVIPIAGIFIAIKSDNAFISFVGYNMVTIPFGIILAPIVNTYSPNLIYNAFGATAMTTATMMIAGTAFPDFFSKIGGALLFSLVGLVVVRVVQVFFPGLMDFSIVDWIAVGIFSLYIGYDWYRASQVERTLNNAIDIAVDLYLDIVNLFLNILRIMAAKDD